MIDYVTEKEIKCYKCENPTEIWGANDEYYICIKCKTLLDRVSFLEQEIYNLKSMIKNDRT